MNHKAGNTAQYSRSFNSYQEKKEENEIVQEMKACMYEMSFEELWEFIKVLKNLIKNKQDQV
mgnify:CR=1 FL=1